MYVPFSKRIGGSNAPMVFAFLLPLGSGYGLQSTPDFVIVDPSPTAQRVITGEATVGMYVFQAADGGHRACPPRPEPASVPGQQQRRYLD